MSKSILQINLGNFGSTGGIMEGIAQLGKARGMCFYSAFPFNQVNAPLKETDILTGTLIENKINSFFGRITGLYSCFSSIPTLHFLRKVKKLNPDIIHFHNLHSSNLSLPILFSFIKKRKGKVIWTLHDCWAFTGHCPHFDMIGCDKWKTGCFNCPQYHVYPASKTDNSKMMYRLKKKWFTGIRDMTIVTPSEWLAGLVKQSFLREYPVKVIHNGIDLSVFQPTQGDFREKYHLEDKKILLGVACPWSERKGLDVFVELAGRLDKTYQIVLVGLSKEQKASLPENIIGLKRTANQRELAELYTTADIFVNPTREDNFPTVNLEALACGTPVVTFRTGGSPESLDESCGIVVEKDDIDQLERAVFQLERNPVNPAVCRSRAELFDRNTKFQEYIKLYEEE